MIERKSKKVKEGGTTLSSMDSVRKQGPTNGQRSFSQTTFGTMVPINVAKKSKIMTKYRPPSLRRQTPIHKHVNERTSPSKNGPPNFPPSSLRSMTCVNDEEMKNKMHELFLQFLKKFNYNSNNDGRMNLSICYEKDANANINVFLEILKKSILGVMSDIVKILIPTTNLKEIIHIFFPKKEVFFYNLLVNLTLQEMCQTEQFKVLCNSGLQIVLQNSSPRSKTAKLIIKNVKILDNMSNQSYITHLKKHQTQIIKEIIKRTQYNIIRYIKTLRSYRLLKV